MCVTLKEKKTTFYENSNLFIQCHFVDCNFYVIGRLKRAMFLNFVLNDILTKTAPAIPVVNILF
jgi:hypothetical protein